MFAKFFNIFLNLIKSIVNIFLAPINIVVSTMFPDLSFIISTFNNAVERLIGPSLGFFSHLLPPITRSLISLYLSALLSYYATSFTVHAIIKIVKLIKEIKFW
ncbi:MAG: hypothetical protein K2I67_02730 [Malacoplasma sp.]|nr:hypothetical protein [Malacoplasma sp.]